MLYSNEFTNGPNKWVCHYEPESKTVYGVETRWLSFNEKFRVHDQKKKVIQGLDRTRNHLFPRKSQTVNRASD